MKPKDVALLGESERCKELALQLNLPLLMTADPSYEFLLSEESEKLSLLWQGIQPPLSLTIDFLQGTLAYRQKQALAKEALIKACGIKGDYRPTIVDVTAGLGRDAFILASAKCRVILCEAHPVIAALLQDGLKRLLSKKALDMQLLIGDARVLLPSIPEAFDIVYLDPMFPPRNKTALVKKDMQILQHLTHDLPYDNENLFQVALQYAKKRVVVKRPDYAAPLTKEKVSFSIHTKHHRFDVYTLLK